MTTRRELLQLMGAGSAGLIAAAAARPLQAQPGSETLPRRQGRSAQGYRPVRTLNGWTLPYRLNNGVKEFHLVAEPVRREMAPGRRANLWG